jgi:hypothetical protein
MKINKHELGIVFVVIVLALFVKILNLGFTGYAIIQPTVNEDTFLNDGDPTSNYGTLNYFIVGTEAGNSNNTGLIKINISDVPAGSTILNANLSLYSSVLVTPPNVTLHRITEHWNESGAAWNFPDNSGTNWSALGGSYSSKVEAAEVISSSGEYYNFTITDLIQEFVNGTFDNYGLLLTIQNQGQAGTYTYFNSENAPSNNPILQIEYTSNVPPTISSYSTNNYVTDVNDLVTFSGSWSDIENNPSQIFVCDTSSINQSGCGVTTFCNTSLSSTNPATCNYNVSASHATNITYHIGICDTYNCSSTVVNSTFIANHAPNTTVDQPVGGEQIHQDNGSYEVKFNISDFDNDTLTFEIYYSTVVGAKTSNITGSALSAGSYCTSPDGNTNTTNNCTYLWNTTGLGLRNVYLNIFVNDSRLEIYNQSETVFNVTTVTDNINPEIGNESITSALTSGTDGVIRAVIIEDNPGNIWAAINYSNIFTNATMTLSDGQYFNGSFEAGMNGTYYYKIYAEDSFDNLNDTRNWIQFNVSQPNATALGNSNPSKALPLSTVLISGSINATYALKDVYAYLNLDDNFVFLSGTPQNLSLGNISKSANGIGQWFIAVPSTEANYTINITYTEKYAKEFISNSTSILVTSSLGNAVVLSGDFGGSYYKNDIMKAFARVEDQSGNGNGNADVNVSIYYPNNTIWVSWDNMANSGSGYYNYTWDLTNAPAGTYKSMIMADDGGQTSIIQSSFTILDSNINVDINSEIEVLSGNRYNAQVLVKDSKGNFLDADGVTISLFDGVGNAIVSNVAYSSKIGTGIYNYSYATTSSQPQGHWLIIANVSYDNTYYEDRQFWKLTGGPFDVRNITIADSTIPTIGISVILENTGGAGQDMTVVWNLTREDTGAQLTSGSETVLVPAESEITYGFNPSSITYTGDAKITIIGYYSGTESAGAYELFTLGEEGDSETPGGAGGGGAGGGGGGGGTSSSGKVVAKEIPIEVMKYTKRVKANAREVTTIDFVLKNVGSINHNTSLILSGIDGDWYSVSPVILKLGPKEIGKFTITLDIPNYVETSTHDFTYILGGNGFGLQFDAAMEIKSYKDSILEELSELDGELDNLEYSMISARNNGIDTGRVDALIGLTKEKLKFTKQLIGDGYYDEAEENIEDIKKHLQDIKEEFRRIGVPVSVKPVGLQKILQYWFWMVTWLLIIGLIIAILLVYKRLSTSKKIKFEDNKNNQEKINEKIGKINKKITNLDEDFERNLLSRQAYESRRRGILQGLRQVREDIEEKNKRDLLMKSINVARELQDKGDTIQIIKNKFKERGWDEEDIDYIIDRI